MSKVMRPTPMPSLLACIAGDWQRKRQIFEIPEEAIRRVFELEARAPGFDVMGTRISLPVGPAAGPNTQIAQSLVTAYLTGGRIFELKTVQVLDRLEIEKPCIETLDEGYNVEWSTELSLEDALAEYLRAWVSIHLLEPLFTQGPAGQFIFNMSVGYTLEGIQSERVDRFIDDLMNPSGTEVWETVLGQSRGSIGSRLFTKAFGAAKVEEMAAALEAIPVRPIHSVTLSTMHGCPPDEIERIARYLMEEKGLCTYVKLNPTLLGYDRVRSILDETGWRDVHIERQAFEKDLQFDDALSLVASLRETAERTGLRFGLKLSNTLATGNDKGRLPGEEMYLSGRALFPITSRLAAELAAALSLAASAGEPGRGPGSEARTGAGEDSGGRGPAAGVPSGRGGNGAGGRGRMGLRPESIAGRPPVREGGASEVSQKTKAQPAAFAQSTLDRSNEPLPFSFCAGVSAMNAEECIRAGLGPLTVATDLLKPGGYLRLEQIAEKAVAGLTGDHAPYPDARALDALASAALERREYRADWKEGRSSIDRELPLFDCFAAPCVEACPVKQNVPAYIRALASGDAKQALGIVLADNPLPTITGLICDHACTKVCCRDDYEGAVDIRGTKLACVRATEIEPDPQTPRTGVGKTAIFGAGPAGLSCAHFLALNGYPVVVFEKDDEIGGVVSSIVPRFRISTSDVERDVERIRRMGVEFRVGYPARLDIESLRRQGFTSFVVASGAPVERRLSLEGKGVEIVGALEFLKTAAKEPDRYTGFDNIVVVGGGFTSLDAVRVAKRFSNRPTVRLLYRRTRAEMPAERAEIEAALEEGVLLKELALPFRLGRNRVHVRVMELGEIDESGRRSPVPTDGTESFECDLLIEAIGETPEGPALEALGIEVTKARRPVFDETTLETSVKSVYVAGDVARGPASIIRAAADGRTVAESILRAAGIEPAVPAWSRATFSPRGDEARLAERGRILHSLPLGPGETEANRRVSAEEVKREADRCLSCDAACLRCVEVCPNRANIAVPVSHGPSFTQSLQILHLDDLCNDCGACGFLCPYETNGNPYKDKPTLFSSLAAFEQSTNPGFLFLDSLPESAVDGRGRDGRGRTARHGARELLLRVHGRVLRVAASGEDPLSDALRAANLDDGAEADFRRMHDLAATVLASHSYLVENEPK